MIRSSSSCRYLRPRHAPQHDHQTTGMTSCWSQEACYVCEVDFIESFATGQRGSRHRCQEGIGVKKNYLRDQKKTISGIKKNYSQIKKKLFICTSQTQAKRSTQRNNKQKDRKTERRKERKKERKRDRKKERKKDIKTERKKDRKKERKKERKNEILPSLPCPALRCPAMLFQHCHCRRKQNSFF